MTPWTVAHRSPLFMGFSRQEYWSGLPFPSPGDLPDPGMDPGSPALQVDSLPSEPQGNSMYMCKDIPNKTPGKMHTKPLISSYFQCVGL